MKHPCRISAQRSITIRMFHVTFKKQLKNRHMKHNFFLTLLALASFTILFNSCVEDNNVTPATTEIYYSQWYTPTSWAGSSGDWYFDVTNSAINQDIVESGIILAYISVPNDIYDAAVRPLPAYAAFANWDYLIPEYGKIEFTCTSEVAPATQNIYFRFVVIPSGTQLSAKKSKLSKEELQKMSYKDVCALLSIPE